MVGNGWRIESRILKLRVEVVGCGHCWVLDIDAESLRDWSLEMAGDWGPGFMVYGLVLKVWSLGAWIQDRSGWRLWVQQGRGLN